VPPLTRWFVKAALVYLVTALLLGILLQAGPVRVLPVFQVAWPTYIHILVVGWLTQLIFGVAFWLFPRYSAEQPRGSERLGWASFALINIGLVLRIIGEPLAGLGHSVGGILVASAVAQFLAGMAFVANTWPRLRER
jgi:hypothetical protein